MIPKIKIKLESLFKNFFLKSYVFKPLANIKSGRLFIIEKCKENWCEVSSQSYSGWITIENVWGKN